MNSTNFNTHIMGRAGSGKTFFISNQASALLKEGKKVLFIDYYNVDTFPEAPSLVISPLANPLLILTNDSSDDAFKYEDLEKTLKDFLQKNSSAKIIIAKDQIGEARATRICNLLLDVILNNQEFFADYFIFIDEIFRFNPVKIQQLLSESKNNRISFTLAHQYMEQLQEDLNKVLFTTCKNIIFKISPFDSEFVASTFGANPAELENLNPFEYREFEQIVK
jgi:RecA/RadA recombinase